MPQARRVELELFRTSWISVRKSLPSPVRLFSQLAQSLGLGGCWKELPGKSPDLRPFHRTIQNPGPGRISGRPHPSAVQSPALVAGEGRGHRQEAQIPCRGSGGSSLARNSGVSKYGAPVGSRFKRKPEESDRFRSPFGANGNQKGEAKTSDPVNSLWASESLRVPFLVGFKGHQQSTTHFWGFPVTKQIRRQGMSWNPPN